MDARELENITLISRSIWSEKTQAIRSAQSALAGSILSKAISDEKVLVQTARGLLQQANQSVKPVVAQEHLNAPFFRLFAEERFLLVALHRARWSYRRLSEVLEETQTRIQEIAWNARIFLAQHQISSQPKKRLLHPTASTHCDVSCPEFIIQRPWPQRFLDDEMAHQERLFILSRLEKCPGCREVLQRCKAVYYAANAGLPDSSVESISGEPFDALKEVWARADRIRNPWQVSFYESLKRFFSKRDVQLATILLLILLLQFEF